LRGENYETGETGTPLDFIAFHAKGAPRYEDDHVRMGIANQLVTIDRGFGIVASFPELRDTPIVIGESDPEGCAACQGSSFSYRNGTVYSSYTAASFARKHELADKHGVNFEGALTWAFEFEDQPYFAGFRQLASNGIPLPVLNVIRMFSRMHGERVGSESSSQLTVEQIIDNGVRDKPDVGVLASRDDEKLYIMLWHYHDDDVAGPAANVELEIDGLDAASSSAQVTHYRVDDQHSNSYAEWQRMGSPVAPNGRQYRRLMRESDLATLDEPHDERLDNGTCSLRFELPRQGVSLLVLDPK
jgi:xylan 1,4-beta-xylosidase